MKNIGLLIIATNKYDVFVKPLIESARNFFLKNHKVTFYVFTDSPKLIDLGDDVILINQEHKPWPYMTLLRYKIFNHNKDRFSNEDFLYYIDADMLFFDEVGDEILGDLVATIHPGFLGGRGTPEEFNHASTAYVSRQENMTYFAGGFNGGERTNFLKMSEVIDKNIDIDLEKNIIAIWHDESHINRYFINNKPTLTLSPSYCYPESWVLNGYTKKIIALDKNHKEIRS
jgi:histo-blood group ABO system transferase